MATKKPKLTKKQADFVRGLAEGKTNTKAALDSYDTDSEKVASVIAAENLGKPSIQEAIELARVKLNITPERVLKPIDDALNDDDVKTRLMGTDRALKLMGVGKGEQNININFNQVVKEDRDEFGI
jgi:phage terminase small subunit